MLRFQAVPRLLLILIWFVVFAAGYTMWSAWDFSESWLLGVEMVFLAMVPAVFMVYWDRVKIVQWGFGHCQGCGYNLTGLTGNRCPECGKESKGASIQGPGDP